MNGFPCALAAVLLLVGTPLVAAARTAVADLRDIIDRGELVVAVATRDVAPHMLARAEGTPGGFEAALARQMGAAMGVSVRFLRAGASEKDAIAAVAAGRADAAMSGIGLDAELAKRVAFSRPYLEESFAVLLPRAAAAKTQGGCPGRNELTHLAGELGVLEDTTSDRLLRAVTRKVPRTFPSHGLLLGAALEGKIAAAFMGEAVARELLRTEPGAALKLRICSLPGNLSNRVAIAVNPGSTALRLWINVFLETRVSGMTSKRLVDRDWPQDWPSP